MAFTKIEPISYSCRAAGTYCRHVGTSPDQFLCDNLCMLCPTYRALPEVSFGLEVRQIFKVRTVWTFSFPDARLLKIEKNPIDPTKISDVLVALFWYIACRRWKILLSFTKKLITGRLSLSLEMKPFKLPGQIDVQYCAQCCVKLFSISLKVYFH